MQLINVNYFMGLQGKKRLTTENKDLKMLTQNLTTENQELKMLLASAEKQEK